MSHVQKSLLRFEHFDETSENSLRREAVPVQALPPPILPIGKLKQAHEDPRTKDRGQIRTKKWERKDRKRWTDKPTNIRKAWVRWPLGSGTHKAVRHEIGKTRIRTSDKHWEWERKKEPMYKRTNKSETGTKEWEHMVRVKEKEEWKIKHKKKHKAFVKQNFENVRNEAKKNRFNVGRVATVCRIEGET